VQIKLIFFDFQDNLKQHVMKKEKPITNYLEMGPFDGNSPEFPSYFCDKDTIFHYTKAKTTVNYVLKNNQLKLSKRLKSFDPMENKPPQIFFEWNGRSDPYHKEASKIQKKLIYYHKNLRQLCFCTYQNELQKNEFVKTNYEYFGCLKPRMWDQYGDHYNGVCLVFSKELIEKHSGLKFRKIKYYEFSKILGRKMVIQENELVYHGKSKYYDILKEKYYDFYFQKHKDYQQENEIRLYSDSAKQNPLFDFKDSLKAIIINAPHKLGDENYFPQILEYAQTKNIDLISLNWDFDGFNVDVLYKAR
jgi:hypothetical protein